MSKSPEDHGGFVIPAQAGILVKKKCNPKVAKKNPRRPEHIKIHKSVAAFALASCPQIVIAQGLGSLNIGKFRRFIKACMLQIGMKKAEKSSKNAKCCDLDNMFTG